MFSLCLAIICSLLLGMYIKSDASLKVLSEAFLRSPITSYAASANESFRLPMPYSLVRVPVNRLRCLAVEFGINFNHPQPQQGKSSVAYRLHRFSGCTGNRTKHSYATHGQVSFFQIKPRNKKRARRDNASGPQTTQTFSGSPYDS